VPEIAMFSFYPNPGIVVPPISWADCFGVHSPMLLAQLSIACFLYPYLGWRFLPYSSHFYIRLEFALAMAEAVLTQIPHPVLLVVQAYVYPGVQVPFLPVYLYLFAIYFYQIICMACALIAYKEDTSPLTSSHNARLHDILNHTESKKEFIALTRTMQCSEVVFFWMAIDEYKRRDTDARKKLSKKIFKGYLDSDNEHIFQVNLNHSTLHDIMKSTCEHCYPVDLYDSAEKEVIDMLQEIILKWLNMTKIKYIHNPISRVHSMTSESKQLQQHSFEVC
jgi:hypothetical protein